MKIKMRAWHCYYYLMLGFLLLHCVFYIGAMLLFKEFYYELLAFLLIETGLVVGLYGYVKKKPIYKPWLWRAGAIIGLIALCYQVYDMRAHELFSGDTINYFPPLIMLVFLAPWLYGLTKYGFSSREIWVHKANGR